MDPVFEAAIARQNELRQELKKIDDFLAMYRTFQVEQRVDSKNESGTKTDNVTAETSAESQSGRALRPKIRVLKKGIKRRPARARVTDNPPPSEVVAATVEILKAAGTPLSRRAIHAELMQRGLTVNGADPIKAVGTMLWRSGKDELVQIEGRGYGLKGVDYPEAPQPVTKEELFS
jgi:hypothetical protein